MCIPVQQVTLDPHRSIVSRVTKFCGQTTQFHFIYIFSLSSSSSFTATLCVLLYNEGFSNGEFRVLNFHSK
ncbi:hypothetical protein VNO80_11997 [Phaseolus coccineus]|uniref:Uncharacterized protein n=1 Tax=Phaseolus coccineus TaxID=3886 RepID=A0AAN9RG01_PHACN